MKPMPPSANASSTRRAANPVSRLTTERRYTLSARNQFGSQPATLNQLFFLMLCHRIRMQPTAPTRKVQFTQRSQECAVEKAIPGTRIALSQDGLSSNIGSSLSPPVPEIELERFSIGL